MTKGCGQAGDYSRGFTLLEVLIAIALLAAGLLGMATLAGSIISYNQLAHHVTTASALAQDRIEELKGIAYDAVPLGTVVESSIDASGNSGGVYTRNTEVDEGAAYQNTKTIVVAVSWDWKGNTHNVVLKTIIAK